MYRSVPVRGLIEGFPDAAPKLHPSIHSAGDENHLVSGTLGAEGLPVAVLPHKI